MEMVRAVSLHRRAAIGALRYDRQNSLIGHFEAPPERLAVSPIGACRTCSWLVLLSCCLASMPSRLSACLRLLQHLLWIILALGRAHTAITICDVYRRTNRRAFARDFLGVRPDGRTLAHKRHLLPRHRRSLILRPLMNVHDSTGLDGDEFNELVRRTAGRIAMPRRRNGQQGTRLTRTNLGVEDRLFLVLCFLRSNAFYNDIAREWQVSRSFISREVRHIAPIISSALATQIAWPTVLPVGDPALLGAHGMIDCTAHWRQEVSHDFSYFRRDVGVSSIGAQVVTSLKGEIWDVVFFRGHNNDQGVYEASGMDNRLRQLGLYLLADLGYVGQRLLRPDTPVDNDSLFEARHRAVRAGIERLFWFVQGWSLAGQLARVPTHIHVVGLEAIYRLAAWLMRRHPMQAPPSGELYLDSLLP
jgi:Helix-turn-helix of DDE superfamily endonuclease